MPRRHGNQEAHDRRHSPANLRPKVRSRKETPDRSLIQKTLGWLVLVLVAGAGFALRPLWVPLVLAAWFALIAKPIHRRVSRWMRGQQSGAGVVTVLLVLATLTPPTVVVLSLAGDTLDLVKTVLHSASVPGGVSDALIGAERLTDGAAQPILDLAQRHGAGALGVAGKIAGATVTLLIALVVFVMGFYSFLVYGARVYRWLLRHIPLRNAHIHGLVAAFHETGRGLLIGVGLTAAAQGGVAGLGYLLAGVPHALVLGLLTAIAALIPTVGTGLIWVPVSIVLGVSGRPAAAVAVLVVGLVVSTVDNFVRPALSRYGKLRLPMFVLFIAMLGGILAFGTWGLILGPLLVRMAIEGLNLLRAERAAAQRMEREQSKRLSREKVAPSSDRDAMGGATPAPA